MYSVNKIVTISAKSVLITSTYISIKTASGVCRSCCRTQAMYDYRTFDCVRLANFFVSSIKFDYRTQSNPIERLGSINERSISYAGIISRVIRARALKKMTAFSLRLNLSTEVNRHFLENEYGDLSFFAVLLN